MSKLKNNILKQIVKQEEHYEDYVLDKQEYKEVINRSNKKRSTLLRASVISNNANNTNANLINKNLIRKKTNVEELNYLLNSNNVIFKNNKLALKEPTTLDANRNKQKNILEEDTEIKIYLREKNRVLQLAKLIQRKDMMHNSQNNREVIYNKYTNMSQCLERLIKNKFSFFLSKIKKVNKLFMSDYLTLNEFLNNRANLLNKLEKREVITKTREKKRFHEKIQKMLAEDTKEMINDYNKLRREKETDENELLRNLNERYVKKIENTDNCFIISKHHIQLTKEDNIVNCDDKENSSLNFNNASDSNNNSKYEYKNLASKKELFNVNKKKINPNKLFHSIKNSNNFKIFNYKVKKNQKHLLNSNHSELNFKINYKSAQQYLDTEGLSNVRFNHLHTTDKFNKQEKNNTVIGGNLLINSASSFPERFTILDRVNCELHTEYLNTKSSELVKSINKLSHNKNNISDTSSSINPRKSRLSSQLTSYKNKHNLNYLNSSQRENNLLGQSEKEYNKVVDKLNIDYNTYLRTVIKENCEAKYPMILEQLKKDSQVYFQYFHYRNDKLEDLKVSLDWFNKNMKMKMFKVKKIRENLERIQNLNDDYILKKKKIIVPKQQNSNSNFNKLTLGSNFSK